MAERCEGCGDALDGTEKKCPECGSVVCTGSCWDFDTETCIYCADEEDDDDEEADD